MPSMLIHVNFAMCTEAYTARRSDGVWSVTWQEGVYQTSWRRRNALGADPCVSGHLNEKPTRKQNEKERDPPGVSVRRAESVRRSDASKTFTMPTHVNLAVLQNKHTLSTGGDEAPPAVSDKRTESVRRGDASRTFTMPIHV